MTGAVVAVVAVVEVVVLVVLVSVDVDAVELDPVVPEAVVVVSAAGPSGPAVPALAKYPSTASTATPAIVKGQRTHFGPRHGEAERIITRSPFLACGSLYPPPRPPNGSKPPFYKVLKGRDVRGMSALRRSEPDGTA